MNVNEMTRKDFEALPRRKWDQEMEPFNSMVIIPGRAKDMHESGYRCMDFVAVRSGEPICLLSGCSDVIHVDGIGGYGKRPHKTIPSLIPISGWSIDCLKKSGFLQIFADSRKMTCGNALSSFEIYAEPKAEGK